jgi:4-nitrophenyl phosphatase
VDALVMGYDFHLTYQKICLASLYVQSGIPFIGTNPDKYTMVQRLKIPGCGSMLKVIEEATSVRADIAGKPNPFIIDHLVAELGLERKECLMIGDNLETDIAFGRKAGIDSLCVLTGVTTEEMVLASNSPTYYSQYLL